MKYYVGTSGWNYFHWINRFYPKGLSSYKWLEYYAKRFSTVEVNMTFYRLPKESALKSWHRRTPKNFVFTLKANRQITHDKKLKEVKNLIKYFYHLASALKEKLGCILWQIPPSLHYDKHHRLFTDFIKELDPKFKNVIEFRHASWWNNKTYQLLKKHKIAFCTVSSPKFPQDIIVTAKHAYFRFHGAKKWYASNYSDKELREWASKIKAVAATKSCKDVYCYFNNDFNAYAINNARELKRLLK